MDAAREPPSPRGLPSEILSLKVGELLLVCPPECTGELLPALLGGVDEYSLPSRFLRGGRPAASRIGLQRQGWGLSTRFRNSAQKAAGEHHT